MAHIDLMLLQPQWVWRQGRSNDIFVHGEILFVHTSTPMAWKRVDLQKHSVLQIFFFQKLFQDFGLKSPGPETWLSNQYQGMFHRCALSWWDPLGKHNLKVTKKWNGRLGSSQGKMHTWNTTQFFFFLYFDAFTTIASEEGCYLLKCVVPMLKEWWFYIL